MSVQAMGAWTPVEPDTARRLHDDACARFVVARPKPFAQRYAEAVRASRLAIARAFGRKP